MQKLFDEVTSLDKRCYEKFALSEDLLMEHAANGIAIFIRSNFKKNVHITVVCGGGNNGADGLALARMLHGEYTVQIFYAQQPKSPMALLQHNRCKTIGVEETNDIKRCDVLVDALFGTGFKGTFSSEIESLMQTINKLQAYKIACDIPSGLQSNGVCTKDTFIADTSLTMGALKKSMFLDQAKEFVGTIKVLDLGISRNIYEGDSKWNLLDKTDLKLPLRTNKNTHKGSFGHLAVLGGEKAGASIMSALAALKFGVGLVTMVANKEPFSLPYSMMYSASKPHNTTALALGMGLGQAYTNEELLILLDSTVPIIADADVFHMEILLELLNKENLVLTPHPKEFIALLKTTSLADIHINELQNNRFKYCELFCKKYPHITLLLKGANVIVGKHERFFVNPHGTSALAKGGSGDVLSGLIGSLLAQGFTPLQATIQASLAHTQLVHNYNGADFSLTPSDLIEGIGNL